MQNIKIINKYNEKLDTLVEGDVNSDITIVFAHGFGTDKHENFEFFDDLAAALKNDYRIVRFDFSGYGKSEGKDEDVTYEKHAADLNSVLEYVKDHFPGKIYILAHSMGTYDTALLSPDGVEKTVFTGIPNDSYTYSYDRLKKRLTTRPGAVFDENGVSLYPRSTGTVQKLGTNFWKSLKSIDPVKLFHEYSLKTKLILFKPLQDEIVGNDGFEGFKKIPTLQYVELNGTHNFKKPEDREVLIKKIIEFFHK
jgi:pimeloyl-ACP methyl ester carboxylesterase